MDKVNSAKEMGSIYTGVLMFYVPVLYAIRTRFLKRTKLGIFFGLLNICFPYYCHSCWQILNRYLFLKCFCQLPVYIVFMKSGIFKMIVKQ